MKPWNQFDNRCDACGAESWVRFERIVEIYNNDTAVQEIHLCGHHSTVHRNALVAFGWTVDDYTHLIDAKDEISV